MPSARMRANSKGDAGSKWHKREMLRWTALLIALCLLGSCSRQFRLERTLGWMESTYNDREDYAGRSRMNSSPERLVSEYDSDGYVETVRYDRFDALIRPAHFAWEMNDFSRWASLRPFGHDSPRTFLINVSRGAMFEIESRYMPSISLASSAVTGRASSRYRVSEIRSKQSSAS